MKAYLTGKMLELRVFPKHFTVNISIKIIIYKIPNRIICHRAFYNIIIVDFACPAFCDKIQLFICHFIKYQNI